jgi:hypothetical protein
MTNREFYSAIALGTINDELIAHAEKAIKQMDETNAKRKEKPSKAQEANAPIKIALLELLQSNPNSKYTEGELGTMLEVSHNKAGSLARQLVAEGKATSAEVKIAKVGKRKVYSIAINEVEDDQ